MDTLKNIEGYVETNVKQALSNPYLMAILKVSLVLYAAQIAPKLPSTVSNIFQNTFVKIAFVALMFLLADIDFQLAIIIAVIYVLSINGLSGRGFLESYGDVSNVESVAEYQKDSGKLTDLLGKPIPPLFGNLIDSKSDNFIGCNNVTMKDLLAVFDGDHIKMQNTVAYSYKVLMEQLPAKSAAKDKLVAIAHAVGLPYNVEFNDKNAPLIATFLLNVGYSINDTCQAPQ
jgi:hypothetical protein